MTIKVHVFILFQEMENDQDTFFMFKLTCEGQQYPREDSIMVDTLNSSIMDNWKQQLMSAENLQFLLQQIDNISKKGKVSAEQILRDLHNLALSRGSAGGQCAGKLIGDDRKPLGDLNKEQNTAQKIGKLQLLDEKEENKGIRPSTQIQNQFKEEGRKFEKILQTLSTYYSHADTLSSLILGELVELTLTGQIFKIRQNYRALILNLLKLENIQFYVVSSSGRIQYQNFSENFIAELLESDKTKTKILEKILASIETGFNVVDVFDNSDFQIVFTTGSDIEKGQCFGGTTNFQGGEEQENLSVCFMVKKKKQLDFQLDFKDQINKRLIQKLVQTSLISTEEESKINILKNYGNNMLDLLELLVNLRQRKVRKELFKFFGAQHSSQLALSNLALHCFSKDIQKDNFQEQKKNIIDQIYKFQEGHYRRFEQIRMYKKYMRETETIFLEFDKNGVLKFISSCAISPKLTELKEIWKPKRPVLMSLFGSNKDFSIWLKKAVQSMKEERYQEFQRNMKMKITKQNHQIQKIYVLVDCSEEIDLSGSSYKEECLKQFKQIDIQIQKKITTLKKIEEENPGVTKDSWLELYIKGDVSESLKRKSSSKRSKTYFLHEKKHFDDVQEREKAPIVKQRHVSFSHSGNPMLSGSYYLEYPNLNMLSLRGRELEQFTLKIFTNLNYCKNFQKNNKKLTNFISELRENYQVHCNPYHNFHHGVNVMQTCYLLSTMASNLRYLSQKDIFTIIFSGLCHDVGHTGFTNAFEISSQSKKALAFNDRSPLENHHAYLTFELLRKQKNNFLSNMQKDDYRQFRQAVIENILFTDFKEHFTLIKKFNQLVDSGKEQGRNNSTIVSNMIVHCSDFGGSVKTFDICKEWSIRVNTEFSNQYKVQGELGLPQTPYMKDLTDLAVLSKAEGGFLKIIVYPLYQALQRIYPKQKIIAKFKSNIQNNIRNWQQINQKEVLKKQEKIQSKVFIQDIDEIP